MGFHIPDSFALRDRCRSIGVLPEDDQVTVEHRRAIATVECWLGHGSHAQHGIKTLRLSILTLPSNQFHLQALPGWLTGLQQYQKVGLEWMRRNERKRTGHNIIFNRRIDAEGLMIPSAIASRR